eukprot:gene25983-11465_t
MARGYVWLSAIVGCHLFGSVYGKCGDDIRDVCKCGYHAMYTKYDGWKPCGLEERERKTYWSSGDYYVHSRSEEKACAWIPFAGNQGYVYTYRECSDNVCSNGKFADTAGLSSCKNKKNCPAGSEVTFGGNQKKDRECAECGVGTYSESQNADECSSCADKCAADMSLDSVSADAKENWLLADGACTVGESKSTTDELCDKEGCTTCEIGTGDNINNNDEQNGARKCRSSWSNGKIVKNRTANRKCVECPDKQYNAAGNSDEPNRCKDWADVCPAGQYESTKPSVKQNRVCTPCGVGKFSTAKWLSDDPSKCKPQLDCKGNEYEVTDVKICTSNEEDNCDRTGTTKRVCKSCCTCGHGPNGKGTFCKSSDDEGWQKASKCTGTDDRTCSKCADCRRTKGKYWASGCNKDTSKGGTDTEERECDTCPEGTWVSEDNQQSCTAHTECKWPQFI